MKCRIGTSFVIVVFVEVLASGLKPTTFAQTNAALDTTDLAVDEKAACIQNLKAIYDAIQTYQNDHKNLPDWLSDLVPQYLPDANVLVCPVCRRTGRIESAPLADPKIASSYLFEFCPVPLGSAAAGAPTRTRREWKRWQMGLVGAAVPIVRCRQHPSVLNLAFDGRIYESPSLWETVITNGVSASELTPARFIAAVSSPDASPSERTAPARLFPPRDPTAPKELIDLTDFYNAKFTNSWHGGTGNDLAALPTGLQAFAGVQFDVRGIVQLGGRDRSAARFPPQIKGIQVHQKCQRLHFLHSAGFGRVADEGKQIGSFIAHFATNTIATNIARLEIPIYYGYDVRNWHVLAGEPYPARELTVAWSGDNAVSKRAGSSIRLFVTSWTNLAPTLEIESIDYLSSMTQVAPFLIAITAD